MKFRKFLSVFLVAIFVLSAVSLASCSKKDDETANTTYVSVYAYNETGKRFLYLDALRVIPNENHEYEWGKTATPFLALDTLCTEKKKTCDISTDIGNNVTVESIANIAAGTSSDGNPYLWYVYVNGKKVEDSKSCVLNNYDFVEFKLEENTFRSISVTFNATDGAKKLIDEQSISIMGDKNDLTLYNLFNISEFNSTAKKEGLTQIDTQQGTAISGMGVKFSEDKSIITSVSEVSASDTEEWVVIINDVVVTTPLSEVVLQNGDKVAFDLQEKDAGDTETPADSEEISEE